MYQMKKIISVFLLSLIFSQCIQAVLSNEELFGGERILITGGTGYLGRTLAQEIVKYNPKEIFTCCIDFNPLTRNKAPNYYYTESKDIIQKPWRILSTYPNPDYNTR